MSEVSEQIGEELARTGDALVASEVLNMQQIHGIIDEVNSTISALVDNGVRPFEMGSTDPRSYLHVSEAVAHEYARTVLNIQDDEILNLILAFGRAVCRFSLQVSLNTIVTRQLASGDHEGAVASFINAQA